MTAKTARLPGKVAVLKQRAAGVLQGARSRLFAYGYLTTSEREVLAIERRLRHPVVRLIGRGLLMRLMDAHVLCDGSVRLPLALRVDGRDAACTLAVELVPSRGVAPGAGPSVKEGTLLFSVTRARGGPGGGADTTRWGCARLALIDWWREPGG